MFNGKSKFTNLIKYLQSGNQCKCDALHWYLTIVEGVSMKGEVRND